MQHSHGVYEVFTPTTQAQLNFVPRRAVDDQLIDALRTPGKQLIVYGESGSGKSTLLLNRLRQVYPAHITTRCSTATTYESLLLDAFDQLDPYYLQGRTAQKSRSVSPALVAGFWKFKASVEANLSRGSTEAEARVLPPQLTAQRLAEFLGAQGMCWVIEDFHKMRIVEKVPFSQSLKIFCDASAAYPDVKTVSIGATGTARQVVEYDPEMRNRVSEILVPLMNHDELSEIIISGQDLLNIDLTRLISPIVQYSAGVPSVCHQLALNACLEKGVIESQRKGVTFRSQDLEAAVNCYVRESSDTLKASFDRALARHKVRRFDNCRLILGALANGPLEGMLYADILSSIRKSVDDYPAGNLTSYLHELTEDRRGGILKTGFDRKYRFTEPLYHTFAQLTLIERSPNELDQWESAVSRWAASALAQLIKVDPNWQFLALTAMMTATTVAPAGSDDSPAAASIPSASSSPYERSRRVTGLHAQGRSGPGRKRRDTQ
jgi:hypothetical protein